MRRVFKEKKELTQEQLIDKLVKYCAYRERCLYEIKEKINSFAVTETSSKACIDYLIRERFLDESRYVRLFVKSKINQGWGVRKIAAHLQQKKVEADLIKSELSAYSQDQQYEKVQQLALKKWNSLKDIDKKKKSEKTIRYLLSRGFEPDAVFKEVKKLYLVQ